MTGNLRGQILSADQTATHLKFERVLAAVEVTGILRACGLVAACSKPEAFLSRLKIDRAGMLDTFAGDGTQGTDAP